LRVRARISLALAAFALSGPLSSPRAALVAVNATVAEQYLLSAANNERVSRGLIPLRHDPLLTRAATEHARAMAEHGTISHQFDGEPDLMRRGASAGVPFSLISENVGEAPDVASIHDMWMHSEHHRNNLLDPAVDAAGISVVFRGGEFFAVEDFARTVQHVGLENQESAIAEQIARSGHVQILQASTVVEDARQTCRLDSGFPGERRPAFIMRFTSDSLTRLPEELRSRIVSGKYRDAAVGACASAQQGPFTAYNFAVLLYR
jgi:uncharacterized protein YkwD